MDYEAVGLVAGLEIHQQLDTEEKLFCHCPTVLRDTAEHAHEFHRYLRVTESELGEIDRAAEEEMMVVRRFTYYAYDTTCLVEDDEEPPAPLNREALDTTLTIAKLFNMKPIEQVHTMRKLVIDGSNTCGFQRTALVALRGTLPGGGGIETICLEEEAAQRVGDEVFSLDRLGIPLVEITTAPCLRTPDEVQQVAMYIGMVLRSTGKVKRGIGTIRQDINISIRDGARVEIKGVQELDLIADVVRWEVHRQQALLGIRDELRHRKASVSTDPVDVTELFRETKSAILRKAPHVLALTLRGFGGLVGRETQPDRRLGSELADYAKKCGVGGIFHTDELPAYSITAEEVHRLRNALKADARDCIVIVAAEQGKAQCAMKQVMRRAQLALERIPEETRRMLEGGKGTAYMRPLPGAARMYPETDVVPVLISAEQWDAITLPELLSNRAARFVSEFDLDESVANQVVFSDRLPVFEQAISSGIRPTLAARTITGTLRELSRDGVDIGRIRDDHILGVLRAVERGEVAKEAVPAILRSVAAGRDVTDAIGAIAAPFTIRDLEELVDRLLLERKAFIQKKGRGALGPLMGVVMSDVRGRVDGKVVSEVLKKALDRILDDSH